MASKATIEEPPRERHRVYKRLGSNRIRGDLQTDALEAIRNALRKGSYDTLTIEQVAAEIGISRRSLYNLFNDKDDMFKQSCERLINAVSTLVIDEIPERMALRDGVRFYIASCVEVYESVNGRDLLLAVIRDGAKHRWLCQAYNRKVRDRLIRAFELFALKKTRRTSFAVHVPRYIAAQILDVVKLRAVNPIIFNHDYVPTPLCNDQQEILAEAYSGIWLIGRSELAPPLSESMSLTRVSPIELRD